MTPATRKFLIIGSIGVVVVGLAVWQVLRLTRPQRYELQGAVITKLDFQTRHGEIEFVHPKSGRTMAMSSRIPPECPIYIDGEPAELTDLRVGDRVDVSGMVGPGRDLRPVRVNATRAGIGTQPATASAPINP